MSKASKGKEATTVRTLRTGYFHGLHARGSKVDITLRVMKCITRSVMSTPA
jgi:hypothetical protein